MGRLTNTALAAAVAVAFSAATPAFAQGVTIGPGTYLPISGTEYAYFFTSDAPPLGSGPIDATFGHGGIPTTSGSAGGQLLTNGMLSPAGSWVDTYTFTILDNGTGSGSLTTETTISGSLSDVDILQVLFNGANVTRTSASTDLYEQFALTDVPITFGTPNTIQVIYNLMASNGNGGYSGHATFTPNAVPEPATWAMMLIGFGAVGYSMRRKRKASKIAQFA